ncbi:MAG TPA: monovalent cation/H+ antiporter complex subunit F [Acidimicrobiales bacterium]|nr:monovalent cation/H+ antiporter complex subunit F [Acidimicrobiales bacterium]
MTAATYAVTALAAIGFALRMLAGPSLTDRMVGLDGLLICGVTAIVVRATDTGEGAFLPVALVVTLVGFVSTAVVARFIEGRGR